MITLSECVRRMMDYVAAPRDIGAWGQSISLYQTWVDDIIRFASFLVQMLYNMGTCAGWVAWVTRLWEVGG